MSPATVNREIALLKQLFNMAEQWGLYRGRNPVRGVKFLAENNLQFRSRSQAEEEDAHTNRESKARTVALLGVSSDKVVTLPKSGKKSA